MLRSARATCLAVLQHGVSCPSSTYRPVTACRAHISQTLTYCNPPAAHIPLPDPPRLYHPPVAFPKLLTPAELDPKGTSRPLTLLVSTRTFPPWLPQRHLTGVVPAATSTTTSTCSTRGGASSHQRRTQGERQHRGGGVAPSSCSLATAEAALTVHKNSMSLH